MNKIPLISICIPSYKRPLEIQETLLSIVTQFTDEIKDKIEIVVSDDAWSDVEWVIKPLMEKYPQIRYYKNKINMRFANWLIANSLWTGKYILSLSNDDSLTYFSLQYLIEIIEKTNFDFLLHKPIFTTDMSITIEKPDNQYTVYHGVREYIDGLSARYHTYNDLISYFSFNSVMVTKASYRHESYSKIDKEKVFTNEFPQEFPPYFDLRDKVIILADAPFLKWRLLNACYSWSYKLIRSFKETMEFIEKQNNLTWLSSWEKIKRICLNWWNRTMYIAIILQFFRLDYKKSFLTRRWYKIFKQYIQQ